MKGIVDRIEGNFVVVELEDRMVNVPVSRFNFTPKSGDILNIDPNGGSITVLGEETRKREKSIRERFNRLKRK